MAQRKLKLAATLTFLAVMVPGAALGSRPSAEMPMRGIQFVAWPGGAASATEAQGAAAEKDAGASEKHAASAEKQAAPAEKAAASAADAHAADAHAAPSGHDAPAVSPAQARAQLMEGNARYVEGAAEAPRRGDARRCDTTTNGQHPIAAVLACADSRVPVEVLFDQGIGDIFAVRVAGNIAEPYGLGSIEYGVEHLGIPLIVVMGHTKCGAVKAAVDGAQVEGNLGELIKEITPAAEETKSKSPSLTPAAMAAATVRANVRLTVRNMTARSPVLAAAVKEGKIKIVGAVYDIHSGTVNWLDADGATPGAEGTVTKLETGDAAPKETEAPAPKKAKGAGPKEGEAHGTGPEVTAPQSASMTPKKDNWMIFGAMSAGAAAASAGLIHIAGKKKASEE